MDFKIDKSTFEKTLNNIVRIIPPKSTYTILQNIIIEAKNKKLLIQATDLDIFIKKVIPAEIKDEGKVLIPGKKILEITKASNVDTINFKLKELKLLVTAGNARWTLPSLDYQEFPEIPKFPEKKWFDMGIVDLQDMVETTIFMVARDISRRPMNGLLMQIKNKELRFVSTDGARLAMHKKDKKAESGDLIIATKTLDLIDFSKGEEKIDFFAEERMMGLKYIDTEIISRLIEGPYPNYEGVIPKEFKGKASIEKDILEGALNRVSLVAPPHIKNVRFEFFENKILLSASSSDFGEAKEEIPCMYDGERIGVWFNAAFVLETLRHLNVNEVIFQLTSATTAALVSAKGDEELLYLLMPLRIDNWE